MRLTRAALALLTFVAVGTGCDELMPVRITAPAASSSVTWMPLALQIDHGDGVAPGSLVVTLNGNDVTRLFVAAPAAGGRVVETATQVWDGLVLPGTNELVARVSMPVASLPIASMHSVSVRFEALGDPYADGVAAHLPGTGGGFGQSLLPGVVTGPPLGAGWFTGGLDVLSLGLGGSIDLAFTNNVIRDGPGVDFTVFENAFLRVDAGYVSGVPFADPGRVSVSQDGITWYAFACTLELAAGPYWSGCAGVHPVLSNGADAATVHASIPTTAKIEDLIGVDIDTLLLSAPTGAGGDSFDLAAVGLAWARFVRIEAAGFVPGPAGAGNAGFDLDAVAAVNSGPATDANGNGVPDAAE
jgi:hypothetical protein